MPTFPVINVKTFLPVTDVAFLRIDTMQMLLQSQGQFSCHPNWCMVTLIFYTDNGEKTTLHSTNLLYLRNIQHLPKTCHMYVRLIPGRVHSV